MSDFFFFCRFMIFILEETFIFDFLRSTNDKLVFSYALISITSHWQLYLLWLSTDVLWLLLPVSHYFVAWEVFHSVFSKSWGLSDGWRNVCSCSYLQKMTRLGIDMRWPFDELYKLSYYFVMWTIFYVKHLIQDSIKIKNNMHISILIIFYIYTKIIYNLYIYFMHIEAYIYMKKTA